MSNQNEEKDISSEVGSDLTKQAKQTGGELAKKGIRKGGKMARKAMSKGAKKIGAAAGKAIGGLLVKIALPIIIFVAVVLLGFFTWQLFKETTGAEGQYEAKNPISNDFESSNSADGPKKLEYMKSTSLNGYNKAISNYYKSYSQWAYWQIDPDDPSNERLLDPRDSGIRDYYEREEEYVVNEDFIYSMDEYLHHQEFKYPEQIVKPVDYDPKLLELRQIATINDVGTPTLVAKSNVWDETDMEYTDEEEIAMHDFGYGSVYKYKKDLLKRYEQGVYYAKDVYNENCKCVQTVSINEPYKEMLEGYPIEIWLLDKTITFIDTTQHAYKIQIDQLGEEADKVVSNGSEGGFSLNKYGRGAVMEEKPVPDLENTVVTDHGMTYAETYNHFYRTWVPENVITELAFGESSGAIATNIELGSSLSNGAYLSAYQYLPVAEQFAAEFDVDPHMIIAIMALESGGNPNLNGDGLMQIAGGTRTITALNANGEKVSMTITEAEKSDPAKAIRWGTMYFANKLQEKEGNVYKALQSYNYDVESYMEKHYPTEWADNENNSWMKHREEARLAIGGKNTKSANYSCSPGDTKTTGSTYGNSCYLEMVLQYYGNPSSSPGTPSTPVEEESDKVPTTEPEEPSVWENFKNKLFSIVGIKYEEKQRHVDYKGTLTDVEINESLRSPIAYRSSLPYEESEYIDADKKEAYFGFTGAASGGVGGGTTDVHTGESIEGIASKDGLILPVNMANPPITSGYGHRWGRLHAGIDLGLPVGTPLYAIADGTVERVVTSCPLVGSKAGNCGGGIGGWGNHVKVKMDNGHAYLYAHMSKPGVKTGDRVTQGQALGLSGNSGRTTGPHLHLEYYINGTQINPAFIFE